MQTNLTTENQPAKISRSKKILRALIFAVVCLVTLLALFHAEENWRGKRAWQKYQHELELKGDKFDQSYYIPPTVPDAENFAQAPVLAPLMDFLPGTQKLRDTNAVQKIYAFANLSGATTHWATGGKADLSQWLQQWKKDTSRTNGDVSMIPADLNFADQKQVAQSVLAALKKDEAVLEDLRRASSRPYSRFNIQYGIEEKFAILLPHLHYLKRTCSLLEVRALAELNLGQTEQAAQDIKFMFYLGNAIKTEPILISHLVRLAMIDLTLQPIWEGLSMQQWPTAQVEQFRHELESIDLFQAYGFSVKGERDFLGASFFEEVRTTPNRLALLEQMNDAVSGNGLLGLNDRVADVFFRLLVPTGWSYFEQITCHRLVTEQQFGGLDIPNHIIEPQVMEEKWKEVDRVLKGSKLESILQHKFFARLLTPSLNQVTKKTGVGQNGVDLARIACALELYRQSNGQYPATLDALSPKFIAQVPHDVIGGKPLKYAVTPDGSFTLYSIGWNNQDDGGKTAAEAKGGSGKLDVLGSVSQTMQPNILQGDWVWRYGVTEK